MLIKQHLTQECVIRYKDITSYRVISYLQTYRTYARFSVLGGKGKTYRLGGYSGGGKYKTLDV